MSVVAIASPISKPRYFGFDPQVVPGKNQNFMLGIEKILDVRKEIEPLHELHWGEVEEGHTPLSMDVNYEAYDKYEQRGQFVLFTVRDSQFALVGYLMCYVHRANHAQNEFVAREDALFLHRRARGGGLANRLMDYAERVLRDHLGCKTLSLSSRHYCGGTNLTHWLTGRGFKAAAVVFTKEL